MTPKPPMGNVKIRLKKWFNLRNINVSLLSPHFEVWGSKKENK